MRKLCTLILTLAFVALPDIAGGTAFVESVDDPSTNINEAARLDASRVTVFEPRSKTNTELATEYAAAHGLTDCVPNERAFERPGYVVLVRPTHPLDGQVYNDRILEVEPDVALFNSPGINVFACKKAS